MGHGRRARKKIIGYHMEGPTDKAKDAIREVADFPDLSVFRSRIERPAVRVPIRKTADLRRRLKTKLLRIPKTKNVYDDLDDPNAFRLLVLEEKNGLMDPLVVEAIEESRTAQEGSRITSVKSYTVEVSYESLSVEDVLKVILKYKVEEIPSSFEAVGHVAHVNLRQDCRPYKYWIGKVILDKNKPRIRTVVNKLGTINNEYRTFGMEVIGGYQGKNWSIVSVKEERCLFQLDFQKVYWNSRLAGEHKRLVQRIMGESKSKPASETVVADVMAGVGPFAVPLTAGHTKVIVHANDLNPVSYEYLKINCTKNKCGGLELYNQDGRAFVHEIMMKLKKKDIKQVSHFIMNLPASAPEFLDAFRGYPFELDDTDNQTALKSVHARPWVHTYCFAPKTAHNQNYGCAVDRCTKALGCNLDRNLDELEIRVVRDVSPSQNMICVSFKLPVEVAELPKVAVNKGLDENHNEEVIRSSKRQKL